MPHLSLEYSANLLEKTHLLDLLKKCNILLAEHLPTDINSCVSRTIECDQYYIGEGQSNSAFIHISLKVKSGRTFATLQKTCAALLAVIREYCQESYRQLNLKISIDIVELQNNYFSVTEVP